ncbi:hypothetical protein BJX99DRAFT_240212 [Aspergillus californicus]
MNTLLLLLAYALTLIQPGGCAPFETVSDMIREKNKSALSFSSDISITIYSGRHCQGDATRMPAIEQGTAGDQTIYRRFLYQSFRLSRPLVGQEQLDLSAPASILNKDPNTPEWDGVVVNFVCEVALKTYFARDAFGTECQTPGPFSCEHLWLNKEI